MSTEPVEEKDTSSGARPEVTSAEVEAVGAVLLWMRIALEPAGPAEPASPDPVLPAEPAAPGAAPAGCAFPDA